MPPVANKEARRAKQIHNMKGCFNCYAENGLAGVGIKAVSEACGCNVASIYRYFDNLDDLIVQATEYCMTEACDEFMAKLPAKPEDLWRFIDEIPYWTVKNHGKKCRLMYQVYTHPKYIEYGKKFFEGVNERYTEYAQRLSPKLGISVEELSGFIFLFVRATVHYAMFEDEFYLKTQIKSLKTLLSTILNKGQNK